MGPQRMLLERQRLMVWPTWGLNPTGPVVVVIWVELRELTQPTLRPKCRRLHQRTRSSMGLKSLVIEEREGRRLTGERSAKVDGKKLVEFF